MFEEVFSSEVMSTHCLAMCDIFFQCTSCIMDVDDEIKELYTVERPGPVSVQVAMVNSIHQAN